MLLTKEVKMQWSNKTRQYYMSKGYKWTKQGDELIVKIEDLSSRSLYRIDLKCDYCGKPFQKTFEEYNNGRKILQKDACSDCRFLKMAEVKDYKQSKGLLKRNDNGYWNYRENRLFELKKYIDKHGTLDNIYNDKEGYLIGHAFSDNNDSIDKGALDLGYDIKTLHLRNPIINLEKFIQNRRHESFLMGNNVNFFPLFYFDNIENIKNEIEKFIYLFGRFPKYDEAINKIGINGRYLRKFGGINRIKDEMGYNVPLKDDNGHYNKSAYEYMVAQWLIHNTNITYLRDQLIFPKQEGNYRSDFTFFIDDGSKIEVEVWGFDINDYSPSNKRVISYLKKKDKKIELYQKHKIELIEIKPSIFDNYNYDKIQENLYKIFQPYLELKYKEIPLEVLVPPNELSDKEIFDKLMEISPDGIAFPTYKIICENKMGTYISFIKKKYNSIYDFAKHFGVTEVYKNNHYWNDEKVFSHFLNMYNNGDKIVYSNIIKIKGLQSHIDRAGCITLFKLKFYESYIDYIIFDDNELKFIKKVSLQNCKTIKEEESKKIANKIIEYLENKNS